MDFDLDFDLYGKYGLLISLVSCKIFNPNFLCYVLYCSSSQKQTFFLVYYKGKNTVISPLIVNGHTRRLFRVAEAEIQKKRLLQSWAAGAVGQ